MPAVIADPLPPEVQALIERRRRLGQDRYDEVWDGVLHINPAPSFEHQRVSQKLAVLLDPLARAAGLLPVVGGVNIGVAENFRIPDASLHEPGTAGVWLPTAELAVEIVSPADESTSRARSWASTRRAACASSC